MRCDTLWHRCRLATMAPSLPGMGVVEDGMVAASGGRILYAGPAADAPAGLDAAEIVDCEWRWITPGLIDCHTHLVHAGDRAQEFEMRLAGADYAAIARAGGGIASTVRATRAASLDVLVATALARLDRLLAEGGTTIEVKSGYGLNLEAERAMLVAARELGRRRDVSVTTSFLGAHALPPGWADGADAYIDEICRITLPSLAAEGLVDAVDGFCETIAFSAPQISRVFETARALGLPVRLHADQLTNMHAAALAARFGALSADHLEQTDEAGVAEMASAGTVAVLLPGAYYFLRDHQVPPVDLCRRYGVNMAVATDCNPGTSPLTSLLLAMNMAATLFRLTVDECLLGTTREAARALGVDGTSGTIEAGKSCDLAIWDIERPAELVYRMGFNPLRRRVWRGK